MPILQRPVEPLDVVLCTNSGSKFLVEDSYHANLLNNVGSYKPVKEDTAVKFLQQYEAKLGCQVELLKKSKIKYNV